MAARIEDYAIIGDTQTCALVDRNATIAWLCFPRFDSDACFAALLGDERHGCWKLSPSVPVRSSSRSYVGDSVIVATDFTTDHGAVRVLDFMPPRGEAPDVVRIVVGLRGEVPMRSHLAPRFGYGAVTPWVTISPSGASLVAGPDALRLSTALPVTREDHAVTAEFTVRAGERHGFVLTWYPSHHRVPRPVHAEHALADTEKYFRQWVDRCTYRGRWRDAVVRSLLTLKILTYAPTGGLVAAATTSLPEQLGGVRNWDYRYTWLRDATLTLRALMHAGYQDEASSWRRWLCRAIAGAPDEMQTMYGVAGERRLHEYTLDWLPGFAGSKPVRVGNAAVDQFQLDIYGEVMDCLHQARKGGLADDDVAWEVQRALMGFVADHWRDPDEGIWEVRGGRRDFTYSKMMAWVAADRAVCAVEKHALPGPIDAWRALRQEIHDDVCARGFNGKRGAFTQSYGSEALDASLLMMPILGFLPPTDERVRGTVAAIERELVKSGLVLRYDTSHSVDGLPSGEGAFVACSFWLADNYVLSGRRADAEALFERLLALRNDVGLLAEEYDASAQRQLGNFPQAFSHLALINTAVSLSVDEPVGVRHG